MSHKKFEVLGIYTNSLLLLMVFSVFRSAAEFNVPSALRQQAFGKPSYVYSVLFYCVLSFFISSVENLKNFAALL